ncbi:MAG: hypothetical protein NC191_07670 [Muribaculaceae bacterium]|nr:hypothetical protein [Muribaculaceae bacterium]
MNISPISNQSFSGHLIVNCDKSNPKNELVIPDYQVLSLQQGAAPDKTIVSYAAMPNGVEVPRDLNTVLNAYNAVKNSNVDVRL